MHFLWKKNYLKPLRRNKEMRESLKLWDRKRDEQSCSMKQVFNLRNKKVWKFISMQMTLSLSVADAASSTAQEEEELHLNPYIVMQSNHCFYSAQNTKKGTFWFSNSDRKAPPRIREVIFVCNLSARWCCVIPADAQQIICLIHDKKTVLTYKLCNNGCHTFTPECTHLFPALRSPRGLRQTCESKDSHTFSFSEKQLRNDSGQKEKLTSDTSGNRIDLWFFTFIFDLLFHFGGHTYQDKNDS